MGPRGSANPTMHKGQFMGRSESLQCTNAMPSSTITTFRPAESNFEVAKSSKSSHHQSSCYERTPKLLALQLRQLCGQRRPTNRLRCHTASFRSYKPTFGTFPHNLLSLGDFGRWV